jgi:hypothetical protein
VLEDGRHVGGEEALPLAEADDERRRVLGRDDLAGGLLGDDGDGVGPLDLAERLPDGGQEVLRAAPWSASAIRWAKISVSVSLENLCPRAPSAAFRARWFSMMPLWTTATPPNEWGWAFSSEGFP